MTASILQADDLEVIRSAKDGKPILIRSRNTERPNIQYASPANISAEAEQIIRTIGAQFGANGTHQKLRLHRGKRDRLGIIHLRYNQFYAGVPVYGLGVTLHLKPNLKLSSAVGRTINNISLNTRPRIKPKKALRLAQAAWRREYHHEPTEPRRILLYVLNKGVFQHKPSPRNYLVWQVQLRSKHSPEHMLYFVDAKRGRVVFKLNGIQDLERWIWDCGTEEGLTCYLNESVILHSQPVILGRSEAQPPRALHPQIDDALGVNQTNLVYDMTGQTYNYFKERYNRSGCNSSGGLGVEGDPNFPAHVIPAVTYLDYFAADQSSKECPTAFFDGRSMWFCVDLVGLDVIAHEYTHALTYYSIPDSYGQPSGLIYAGESGALNEAFSDIFGAAVENYATHGQGNWRIGEETRLASVLPMGAFRDLSHPTAYYTWLGRMPDRFHSDDVWCDDSVDYGGVHHNMSIFSFAAYLMAAGGNFNGCTIESIGRTKQEAVFYYALTGGYLLPAADFNHAYVAVIAACGDLYGATSHTCKQVAKALKAVEMDQPGKCSGKPSTPPSCQDVDDETETPAILILAPRSGERVKGSQTITFINTNPKAPQCSIRKNRWKSCRSGVTRLKNLPGWKKIKAGGTFTLRVRDTAANGKRSSSSQPGIKKSASK